jgi:integrator complex subunit 4
MRDRAGGVRAAAAHLLSEASEGLLTGQVSIELAMRCARAVREEHCQEALLESMILLWRLSQLYPESAVPSSYATRGNAVRMADHAFLQLCECLASASMEVRVRACHLLGSLRGVSEAYLLQALSKKAIQVGADGLVSLHRKNQHAMVEARLPDGDSQAFGTNWKLLESNAAGAFVHGLEDEFLQVRMAAVGRCPLSWRWSWLCGCV